VGSESEPCSNFYPEPEPQQNDAAPQRYNEIRCHERPLAMAVRKPFRPKIDTKFKKRLKNRQGTLPQSVTPFFRAKTQMRFMKFIRSATWYTTHVSSTVLTTVLCNPLQYIYCCDNTRKVRHTCMGLMKSKHFIWKNHFAVEPQ
jgi:hypothetical protein